MRWPAAISAAKTVAAKSGVPMKTRSRGTVIARVPPTTHTLPSLGDGPLPPPLAEEGIHATRTAAPPPLQAGEGWGGGDAASSLRRREGAGLFRLGQLAQNDAALQRRDVVDEE